MFLQLNNYNIGWATVLQVLGKSNVKSMLIIITILLCFLVYCLAERSFLPITARHPQLTSVQISLNQVYTNDCTVIWTDLPTDPHKTYLICINFQETLVPIRKLLSTFRRALQTGLGCNSKQ